MLEREGKIPQSIPGCRRRRAGARLFLLACAFFAWIPPARPAQVLIAPGQTWKYAKGTAEASTPVDAWRAIDFDDRTWLTGRSGIGYGDGDDATVLSDMPGNYLSIFLRKSFSVTTPAAFRNVELLLDYDDGFVAYLNGVEIARRGLAGDPVPFDATAATHPAGAPESFVAASSLLAPGKNVLAIQVHNDSLASSGLTAIPRLLATAVLAATRGPYLQLGGPDTQTVVWQTSEPSDGIVEYGPTPALGLSASDPAAPGLTHAVTLSGLESGTVYHYRLVGKGEVAAEGFSFRTFPAPGSPAPFRLAAWGDSGTGTQNQVYVGARIEALLPDLAIHTGDIVYDQGQPENFNPRYFTPYRSWLSRINVFTCLGNHDTYTANGQPYLDAFYLPANNPAGTERYYSFDYGNVHLISLDTNLPFGPGSPQRLWLERDLATRGGFWTIAFHHHTPYTVSPQHADDSQNAVIRAYLAPLYELHGVDLVVVGHSHCYERTFPLRRNTVLTRELFKYQDLRGPVYVTTGGGGRDLHSRSVSHPNNAFLAVFKSEFHTVAIDFSDAGIDVRAIRHDSALIDSFHLSKSPDTAPPVISKEAAVDVTETGARIIWETDEPAGSLVEYGPGPVLRAAAGDEVRVISHAVALTGLSPGVEYHYRVLSRDRAGNQGAGASGTFFTAGAPLHPATVAWWRCEGNLFDAAPGGRHGSAQGARYSSDVPAARVPQTGSVNLRSLTLDGTVRVALPDPGLLAGASGTLECFFRAKAPLADQALLFEGRPGEEEQAPASGLEVVLTAGGAVELREAKLPAAEVILATAEGLVAAGEWHHLALVFERGSATLYLDGLERDAGPLGAIDRSEWVPELLVGAAAEGAVRAFVGEVDEVRISDRPLIPARFLLSPAEFRLELAVPEKAARSDPLALTLTGASSLPLLGLRALVLYDPLLVEFIGSAEEVFGGTPWTEGRIAATAPGRIEMVASRPEAGAAPAVFATLHFRARACTGSAAFDLDPSEAFLVVRDPEATDERPVLAGSEIVIEAGPTFVRGDADGAAPIDPRDPGSAVDLTDGIFLLQFLFLGGAAPPCLEAADVNADGRLTLGDPVLVLLYLFASPAPATIPPPWPQPGRAPDPHFSCDQPAPSGPCAPVPGLR